ncbi:unnamed protein product [Caenorhabditis bovis]|uniref:MADF domain-containing protein n=1 Tax=Caenorhabditis bovis TaxID=2654633 RepID=A0A8S1EFT9_9PELO|nr:unnamed protein product [Caenorhabditis bovis]
MASNPLLRLFGFNDALNDSESELADTKKGRLSKNGAREAEENAKIEEKPSIIANRTRRKSQITENDKEQQLERRKSLRSVKKEPSKSPTKLLEDSMDPDDGEIRRSKRDRKPNSRFSPSKMSESVRKNRKRSAALNSVEQIEENVNRCLKMKKYQNDDQMAPKDNDEESFKTSTSGDEESVVNSDFSDSEEIEDEEPEDSSTSMEESERFDPKTEEEERIFYRRSSNSSFMPRLKNWMINGSGDSIKSDNVVNKHFQFRRSILGDDFAPFEKVRQIIDAVRRRPIIWDLRLNCHRDHILVRKAWLQIDQVLGNDQEFTLHRRKQIWKNKRDYYVNLVLSQKTKEWSFSREMEFYRPMILLRHSYLIRPSVLHQDGGLRETAVLANKNIICNSDDKINVLKFILKSINDAGICDESMMEAHELAIERIFLENYALIANKYRKN